MTWSIFGVISGFRHGSEIIFIFFIKKKGVILKTGCIMSMPPSS